MKFIITESQYNRLLTEQKVYTSQTEYDKAMVIYNRELDKYNKLLKQIDDIKKSSNVKKKVPKKTSPGRKVRSWVNFISPLIQQSTITNNSSQSTINMAMKTLDSMKKPVKPILKLPVVNEPTSDKPNNFPSKQNCYIPNNSDTQPLFGPGNSWIGYVIITDDKSSSPFGKLYTFHKIPKECDEKYAITSYDRNWIDGASDDKIKEYLRERYRLTNVKIIK